MPRSTSVAFLVMYGYVWLCGVYVGVVLSNEILTPPLEVGGVKKPVLPLIFGCNHFGQ